jgi:hypothetical protein
MESTVISSKVERRKQGKALREKCSRTSQGEWKPRSKSQDIIKLLEESDADRIAGLIPVKYQRMSVSPLTFYRGTAINLCGILSIPSPLRAPFVLLHLAANPILCFAGP